MPLTETSGAMRRGGSHTKAGPEGCKEHMSARIPKFGHHRFTLHSGKRQQADWTGQTLKIHDTAALLWGRSVS